MSVSQKKFVILGGGAAGVLIGMKLANTGVDITLVDNKSFYEYTPGLCSVLYEATEEQFNTHFKSITFELAPFLQKLNITFIKAKVENIKDEKVYLNDGKELTYDILAICTGSSYADPWKTHDNDDIPARLAYLTEQRNKYKQAEKILCIGGGPVGVELCAEIAYRSPAKKITLVDTNEYVLASAPNQLGKSAQHIINALPSITSISNEKASKNDDGDYETDKSHTIIKPDLVYNCIGVTPNTKFIDESWLNEKKQIIVDDTLKLPSTKNVFAIGDANSFNEPKMFYTAHMQAIHFVNNMPHLLNEKPLKPYKKSRPNMVISMGPDHAVGHISGISLTGWPLGTKKGSHLAAWSKHSIERITMDDFGLKKPVNQILYCISRPLF